MPRAEPRPKPMPWNSACQRPRSIGPSDGRTPTELPDYALRNRTYLDAWTPNWVAAGGRNWAASGPMWGIWAIPESQLDLLADVEGPTRSSSVAARWRFCEDLVEIQAQDRSATRHACIAPE